MKGAKDTALFNIDATIGGPDQAGAADDGVLGAIGKLGIKASNVAFDIWSDGARQERSLADRRRHALQHRSRHRRGHRGREIAGVSGMVKDIAIMGM